LKEDRFLKREKSYNPLILKILVQLMEIPESKTEERGESSG